METLNELSVDIATLNTAVNEAVSLGSVLNALTSTTSDIAVGELAGTTDILERRLRQIEAASQKIKDALLKQYSTDN